MASSFVNFQGWRSRCLLVIPFGDLALVVSRFLAIFEDLCLDMKIKVMVFVFYQSDFFNDFSLKTSSN
ncbi:hypothetical protein IHE45_12G016000 [Dioscorea alata]|uniref:Uncharacterized protein n=1 Tax=Dioscorea alata TaxID=55571 RepID=A0ACB7V0K7_DIOAL|nr:hypothetical protein IHE45_12G016000 [Dioscorea alata]